MTSKVGFVNSSKSSKKTKTNISHTFELHMSLLSTFVGSKNPNALQKISSKYNCKMSFKLPKGSDPLEGACSLIIEAKNRQNLKNALDEVQKRYNHVIQTVLNIQKQLDKDGPPQEQ